MRTAAAAREAAATTSTASTEAAAASTRANSSAAAAGAGAWSRYSGIAKVAVAVVGYESIKSAGNFQKATNVYVTAAGETAAGLKQVRSGMLDIASGDGHARSTSSKTACTHREGRPSRRRRPGDPEGCLAGRQGGERRPRRGYQRADVGHGLLRQFDRFAGPGDERDQGCCR
jgi:hypothetical protein